MTDGALVDRSNQVLPLVIPARRPPSPSAACSTVPGSGSEVKTTSPALPASPADPARAQPASMRAVTASARTS